MKDADGAVASSSGRPFHDWLAGELRGRGISQRQLAMRSGVDHSTISRLLGGTRSPTLHTAAALARGLQQSGDHPSLPGHDTSTRSAPSRVEDALHSDDLLSVAQIRAVMSYYLSIRQAREATDSSIGSTPSR